MDSRKKILPTALALSASLVWATLSLSAGSGVPRMSSQGPTVEPAQRTAFTILRAKPNRPPDDLARRVERVVEGRGFGLQTSLARKVRTQLGDDAWVIPGKGYLCVVASTPIVAGCNTTAATIAQGMSVVAILPATFGGGKQYDLYGLAPDDVQEVVVQPENAPALRVPVVHNVYSYAASTMLHARLVRSSPTVSAMGS